MKAYEVPVKISSKGELKLPESLLALLPLGQVVRVIVLVPEPSDLENGSAWLRLTEEQFLAGYDETDTVYDTA